MAEGSPPPTKILDLLLLVGTRCSDVNKRTKRSSKFKTLRNGLGIGR